MKERVIGPYFFENENVTGESYRKMPIDHAFSRLSYLREDYIFRQDGTLPHFSTRLNSYLNNKQSDNWIG